MTPSFEATARELAKYFDWGVPSEQYSEVLKALREAHAAGLDWAEQHISTSSANKCCYETAWMNIKSIRARAAEVRGEK